MPTSRTLRRRRNGTRSRSIRQAQVGSTKTMFNRVKARFEPQPERQIADTACGTAPMLGRLADQQIAPQFPVFDKSGRSDGTWTRADVQWDAKNDQYICPEGHELKQFRRNYSDPTRGPTGKGTAPLSQPERDLPSLPIQGHVLPERGCSQDHPRGA